MLCQSHLFAYYLPLRSDLEKHETRNMSDKNRRFGASCAIIKVT